MEDNPPKENPPVDSHKFECILKCKDAKSLFRFPRDEPSRRVWLQRLNLDSVPRSVYMSRLCNNHFSERMFSEGGKRLTGCAVPDINIPGLLIDKTPDGNLQIIKPRPIRSTMKIEEIPRIVQRAEIITSRNSRCFLKCKDAKTTFGFPQDKPSLDVWVNQLGLKRMPPRTSTARMCMNHFSARMFTTGKGRRLTRCAIPDLNLPGKTIFIPEDEIDQRYTIATARSVVRSEDNDSQETTLNMLELPETATSPSQNDKEISEMFRAMLDPPLIIEEDHQSSRAEILINPIENIKHVINSAPNKEGILHVFQPGIERKKEDKDSGAQVVLPENVVDAESECVLKCPHGERLFRFPNNESQRQQWLRQIGLTHCFFNTKICDRHFSDNMFVKSKKRLAKFAFPDQNIPDPVQPRINDPSKVLNDFRIILQDKHVCDVIELPQYICVLTVFKEHTEVDAVVNGIKYVRHKVDQNVPKREREVQVDVADLIRTANVAIPADDYVDQLDIVENVDFQQLDWLNTFKSHVFTSKADMFECLICGEISVGYACNVKHSNVHKESSSLCFQCGRMFSSQYKLKLHEKEKHLNQIRKALRCPKMYCKKAFHSKKQLHLHVDEHTRYNEHKCKKCLRVFPSSLKLHCHQVACRNCWILKYSRRNYGSGMRAKIK